MTFRQERADDGLLLVVFGSSLPLSTKTNAVSVGTTLTKLSGSTHALYEGGSKCVRPEHVHDKYNSTVPRFEDTLDSSANIQVHCSLRNQCDTQND